MFVISSDVARSVFGFSAVVFIDKSLLGCDRDGFGFDAIALEVDFNVSIS